MDNVTIIRIVAGLLFLLLYFLPSVIGKDKRNAVAIFLVNLLTGWSVIGWVVALIWALTNDPAPVVAVQPQVAVLPTTQSAEGNRRKRNFGLVALIVVALGIAIAIFIRAPETGKPTSETSTPAQETAQPSAPAANEYHESDEVISPYEISTNPYKFKEHSGILDTINVPVLMGGAGAVVTSVRYPGGSLKFEKMIDEHTATYSVLVGEEGSVMPDGEVAVILRDSDPPNSGRPWRVFVEGPMEAANGLGQTITLTAVRFEGYYSPSPEHAQAMQAVGTEQTQDAGTTSSEPAAK